MPWLETPSDTFVARHDARDALDVERVLAQLEHSRARLDARFPKRLGSLAVVLHGSAAQLDAAEHRECVAVLATAEAVAEAAADREMTPVAVASLLLWGRVAFGDGWFETAARGTGL